MAETDVDRGGETAAATAHESDAVPVFHLPVGDDGAVVLPAELRRRLGVDPGDTLAVAVAGGGGAFVTRWPEEGAAPVAGEEGLPLAGLLKGYFADREDVQRFLDDERRGWEERLQTLER